MWSKKCRLDGRVLFWISQLGIKAFVCLSGAIGHDDISEASMRLTSQSGLGDNNVLILYSKNVKKRKTHVNFC